MYVAGHLGFCYLLPLEIVLWRIALGTLTIIFLFNLIDVKCMYAVIPFMKGEKDVCMLLRLNRALEQETEREHIWERWR